jgi:hypothetical protein
VDEGFVGSLLTALGLRDAGLDIVLLGAVGSRRSYCAPSFTALTGPVPSDERFLPSVRATTSDRGCDCIMPATEPTMLALHQASATLPAPLFPQLAFSAAQLIADKARMSELVKGNGVSVPRQVRITGVADVRAALARVGLPAVVKATFGRGGDGTRIVHDAAAAERTALQLLDDGRECMVQEYVHGQTWLVGGLFDRGRALRLYAGEKIEQQPSLTGPAARIRSVGESALTSAATRVFAALRWTGLASADFVRAADGGFHFLEVNPRPWGSIAAAADAQVDLFTPLADLMCGGTPAPDLAYTRDVETRILPLYLLNPRSWLDIRTAVHIITDLRSRQGAMFRSPGLALHVLHRLLRVRANWPPAHPSKRSQSQRARRDWTAAQ